MAKKYIDAQKLERHFENCIDEVRNTNGVTEDFEIALIATKNQPAADVQPVKHGRWIYENFYTHCSSCGNMAIYDKYSQEVESDYCPRCGAKMDGDING